MCSSRPYSNQRKEKKSGRRNSPAAAQPTPHPRSAQLRQPLVFHVEHGKTRFVAGRCRRCEKPPPSRTSRLACPGCRPRNTWASGWADVLGYARPGDWVKRTNVQRPNRFRSLETRALRALLACGSGVYVSTTSCHEVSTYLFACWCCWLPDVVPRQVFAWRRRLD